MPRKTRHICKPAMEALDDRCLLSASGFSPAQIKAAYNLSNIDFKTTSGAVVAGDGTGETIAIVVAFHDPYLQADLNTFDATYGLPNTPVNQVDQAGSATNDGWAAEETLDVEWAHAIAPGAKIDVIESASDNTNDLLTGVATARNLPGVVAVSMSWGGPELGNETSYDSTYFTTPAGHPGITFVAASGDNGTSGGAEWPASSPNVLAVGGTTLTLNSTGGYGSETAWNGSGAGISVYETEPSYQNATQSTGKRIVPDVAFLADPNTGVQTYTTNPSDGQGSWSTVGGTSLGTPAWAAIISIIDQGLNLNGTPSLNGATETLPELYSLAGTTAFNAVANSQVSVGGGGGGSHHHRGGGGGTSTTISSVGLGTPNGANLISALVPNTTTTPPTSSTPPTPPATSVATVEVQKLYQAILGRAPDSVGLAAAVAAIEGGTPVAQIASGLLHSVEYDMDVVIHDYQADLGRTPAAGDVAAAVAALQGGESLTFFNATLLASVEFNQDYPTSSTFAQAVYQATLGRPATGADITAVTSALASGINRYQIIQSLLSSPEAYTNTIDAVYEAYLGRMPDTAAVDNALAAFQAGTLDGTRLAILLAGSAEFQADA